MGCFLSSSLVYALSLLIPIVINAFPFNVTTETFGGLISDEVALLDRQRIKEEARTQLGNPFIVSNTTGISISCPSNLTVVQNDVTPFNVTCNLTYRHISLSLAVSFETDIQNIALLSPAFWIYLAPTLKDQTLNVVPLVFSIRAHRMGSTFLKVWVREARPSRAVSQFFHVFNRNNLSQVNEYYDWLANVTADSDASVMGFQIKVLRPRGVLELAFRIVIIILVCGITFLIGCELDGRMIWRHLKTPVGPIIGFVCQFGLMPLIAFSLAMVVPIKHEFGFGLLATGCCPGGGGSNIWTLLLHGDLNLSMTMTFISSIAALGMMPLMLFIFGRFFVDTHALRIPFLLIAGQLCYIAVPVILGMLLKWRLPRIGQCLVRLLRPLSFLFIAIIIGFGVYTNLPIYRLLGIYPVLIPTATALPWIGFLFGGVLASICRRSKAEILTISIETGIQSSGIAILVLIYSMPQPEGDVGAVMPIVVSIFTPLPLAAALIAQKIKNGKLQSCSNRKNRKTEIERGKRNLLVDVEEANGKEEKEEQEGDRDV